MNIKNIRIRDPFVLVEGDTYYMYGTTELCADSRANSRFSVYISKDLETFEGPFVVFDGEQECFWADRDYWGAEVWKYHNKFYLFGSFKTAERTRASHILVSDSPMGPFKPVSEKPATPEEWECLDGTLFVDAGEPYMIFCREWLQCENGEMYAVKLKADLSGIAGEPILLFKAGDNPAVNEFAGHGMTHCKVTDGPFLYRENGKINMIWSSIANGKYAILRATADSLCGPWKHYPSQYDFDGGHAMLFTDLQGVRRICFHSPNTDDAERAVFLPIE